MEPERLASGSESPLKVTRPAIPWLLIASTTVSLATVILLVRYAIDLLIPFCVLVVIAHSVRDAFGDWLSGARYEDEPDPVWAVVVLAVSCAGTLLGLAWILSTSPWAERVFIRDWVPSPVVSSFRLAEQFGWGHRAVLSGGPVHQQSGSSWDASAGALNPPEPMPTRSDTSAGMGGGLVEPRGTSGTGSEARSESVTVNQETARRSHITLQSSARLVTVGAEVQLTARVVVSGDAASGRVVFMRNNVPVGTASVGQDGAASLRVANLPRGVHTILAEFEPAGHARGSRSLPLVVVVR